jgi:hypothetical protein
MHLLHAFCVSLQPDNYVAYIGTVEQRGYHLARWSREVCRYAVITGAGSHVELCTDLTAYGLQHVLENRVLRVDRELTVVVADAWRLGREFSRRRRNYCDWNWLRYDCRLR